MDGIKLIAGDVSEDFYDRLVQTFPMSQALWRLGDEVADTAYKAGQQNIIEWIYKHAKISPTRSS